MSREFTNRMIELVEEGMFNEDILIANLLNFLSETEVKDFVRLYEFFGFEDLGYNPDPEADVYGDNALEEDFVTA